MITNTDVRQKRHQLWKSCIGQTSEILVQVCEKEINPESKKPDKYTDELRMSYAALCKRCVRVGGEITGRRRAGVASRPVSHQTQSRKERAVRNSGKGWRRGSRWFIKRCSGCAVNVRYSHTDNSTVLEKQTFLRRQWRSWEPVPIQILKWYSRKKRRRMWSEGCVL